MIEAKDWQNKAVRHIKTLAKTFGSQRNPGNSGTWQRGYFDNNPASLTYRQFLFNESKQGWKDSSTWSRGQAWMIYDNGLIWGDYFFIDALIDYVNLVKDTSNQS